MLNDNTYLYDHALIIISVAFEVYIGFQDVSTEDCRVGYFASFSAFIITAAYLRPGPPPSSDRLHLQKDLPTPLVSNRPDDGFGQRATERDVCSRRLERAAQHRSAVQ